MSQNPPEPEEQDSRRGAIIGLVVVLVLVVAGYFLVTSLRDQGRVEDCLMAGRHNCAPIESPAPSR